MKVCVQTQDFDLNAEIACLRETHVQAGALASFVGVVRSEGHNRQDYALELEHYPGMTEKVIAEMVALAVKRFQLLDATVIHRVGRLPAGEQIVLVLTAAQHRRLAFEGCEFIMDYLKTQAPFWKKEHGLTHSGWVDARESDDEALRRWGIHSSNSGGAG